MIKTTIRPDDFLNTIPADFQEDMKWLDAEISAIMQGHPHTLWQGTFWGGSEQNIIGYGDLTFTLPGGVVEWFMVGLAAQKNYISLYVNAVEGDRYLAEKYADTLGKVKVGKSSISFKKLENVNLPLLLDLIKKAKQIMTTGQ